VSEPPLTEEAFRAKIMADFNRHRPMSPREIIESVRKPGAYTMTEGPEPLSVEIVCEDLSDEEERLIAGAFTVEWRVRINGRRPWDILS
jgi:hypothetical protein